MAKTNNIRKRALEHAKKQRWDKALEEFERLIEVEQHNPNLFNEIGDLYLKLGRKREAFESYHSAVDAYARISLHNNAVAVCKKILRLNPNDQIVSGKLATLRHKQGFQKDAESCALTFVGQLNGGGEPPTEKIRELVVEVTRAAGGSVEVLERATEYLIASECPDEAGKVLEKLEQIYQNGGQTDKCELVRQRMDSIGWVASSTPGENLDPEKLETVEAARGSFVRGAGAGGGNPGFDGSAGAPNTRSPGAVEDWGTVELGPAEPAGESRQEAEPADAAPANGAAAGEPQRQPEMGYATPAEPDEWGSPETADASDGHAGATVTEPTGADPVTNQTGQGEWIIPDPDVEPQPGCDDAPEDGGIIGELSNEVTADIDEEDYRSHYDLGMAYVEMNLLAEAIREFQFAANSAMYQIRSLEMIGRCFIDQNKPQLAIKQLTRGLSLVGDDDQDSLGIRYSLGVAYEMTGELEKARSFFEDVYVVDVSFRDVAERMEKYAK